MKLTRDLLKSEVEELEAEREKCGPSVTIRTNAPLALQQLALECQIDVLRLILNKTEDA